MKELLRKRLAEQAFQLGVFQKTPSVEIVELLALSGIDFVCFDSEHANFGRRELDVCLAFAVAVNLPALVRVSAARPEYILQALDGGAMGVLVPHISSSSMAKNIVKWARYGSGGRGFAGSTRSARFGLRQMSEVLAEPYPVVIAQLEDPSAVAACDEIAEVAGLSALFFGSADYAVALGCSAVDDGRVVSALERIINVGRARKLPIATYASDANEAAHLRRLGVNMIFVGSDQSLILKGVKRLKDNLGV